MKPTNPRQKITVQLWEPLIEKLNQTTTSSFLNRDAYLDMVFAKESKRLVIELNGKRNSVKACAFVKRCLVEMKNLRTVTLTLSEATARLMTKSCDEVNVWRDVFVNRVIYLLVANPSALERVWEFKFDEHYDVLREDTSHLTSLLLGPRLLAIRELVTDDALWGIRAAIGAAYPDTNGAIHSLALGSPEGETAEKRGLAGFNTYLEDLRVPGTTEHQEHAKWMADLL
jgi:hypothetical protein